MSQKIIKRVSEMIAPKLEEMGLRVYDTVFLKEGNTRILRLYIDKKDGYVNIEECEKVSCVLSDMLDADDFIEDAYTLEVSSPGIERVLKYNWHFKEAVGKTVDIKLYSAINNKKHLTGILKSGGEKETIVIETDEGTVNIEPSKAAEVKIHFEF